MRMNVRKFLYMLRLTLFRNEVSCDDTLKHNVADT
jgi:hypothetical protein